MKRAIWVMVICGVLVSAFLTLTAFNLFSGLKDFESPADLQEFLELDDTDSHVYYIADGNGDVIFGTQYCGARAIQLKRRAELKGYSLNLEALSRWEFQILYGWRLDDNTEHLICSTVIGHLLWFIEPANDRIWVHSYIK